MQLIILVFLSIALFIPTHTHALEPIEITTIDPTVHSYATFGSYNQHVVQNQNGIFLTYKKTQVDEAGNGLWRIYISRDGGKSFGSIGEASNSNKPPVLETDSAGNIYLATGYDSSMLCVYQPSNNYSNPKCVSIPESPSGKFALYYDAKRSQLYYFSHSAHFSIFDTNLNLKAHYQFGVAMDTPSLHAYWQYPLLTMDENGNLYAAWTTQKVDQYLYWSIHTAVSPDGGYSWTKLNKSPLSLPITPDETGPTDRITLDDEFSSHTWLKNLLAKNGKLYFPYITQSSKPRYHFTRYDLSTGNKDQDIPWNGETLDLSELHGFCASKASDPNFPIYCASRGLNGNLNITVTYDQGATWHDYATGKDPTDTNIWSVSGYREITSDNYLIGTYTNQNNANVNQSSARFFRVKVSATRPTIKPGDINGDGHVNLHDYNLLVANYGNPYTLFDYNNIVANYEK